LAVVADSNMSQSGTGDGLVVEVVEGQLGVADEGPVWPKVAGVGQEECVAAQGGEVADAVGDELVDKVVVLWCAGFGVESSVTGKFGEARVVVHPVVEVGRDQLWALVAGGVEVHHDGYATSDGAAPRKPSSRSAAPFS
jgi:hypothetical protein